MIFDHIKDEIESQRRALIERNDEPDEIHLGPFEYGVFQANAGNLVNGAKGHKIISYAGMKVVQRKEPGIEVTGDAEEGRLVHEYELARMHGNQNQEKLQWEALNRYRMMRQRARDRTMPLASQAFRFDFPG